MTEQDEDEDEKSDGQGKLLIILKNNILHKIFLKITSEICQFFFI